MILLRGYFNSQVRLVIRPFGFMGTRGLWGQAKVVESILLIKQEESVEVSNYFLLLSSIY